MILQLASAMNLLIIILGALLTCADARKRSTRSYTSSWAVEVVGGREKADAIALKHGFINEGQVNKAHIKRITLLLIEFSQVGVLEDFYRFKMPEYRFSVKGHGEMRDMSNSLKQDEGVRTNAAQRMYNLISIHVASQ